MTELGLIRGVYLNLWTKRRTCAVFLFSLPFLMSSIFCLTPAAKINIQSIVSQIRHHTIILAFSIVLAPFFHQSLNSFDTVFAIESFMRWTAYVIYSATLGHPP